MNYINRLQSELAQETARVEALELGMQDLRAYLQSPKFWEDHSVNVTDVLLRLDEIWFAANRAEDEAYQRSVA